MNTPPTQKKVNQYVNTGGGMCPFCGPEDYGPSTMAWPEGGPVEIQEGRAYQPMHCTVCGARWTDGYTLDGLQPDPVDDQTFDFIPVTDE